MVKTNSSGQFTLTLSHWEKYGWTAHTKNLVTRIHFHHPRTLMRKIKKWRIFFGKNGNGNENGNIYVIYDSFLYQNPIHVLLVLSCDIPIATSYASSALSILIYMLTLVLYISISPSIKQWLIFTRTHNQNLKANKVGRNKQN